MILSSWEACSLFVEQVINEKYPYYFLLRDLILGSASSSLDCPVPLLLNAPKRSLPAQRENIEVIDLTSISDDDEDSTLARGSSSPLTPIPDDNGATILFTPTLGSDIGTRVPVQSRGELPSFPSFYIPGPAPGQIEDNQDQQELVILYPERTPTSDSSLVAEAPTYNIPNRLSEHTDSLPNLLTPDEPITCKKVGDCQLSGGSIDAAARPTHRDWVSAQLLSCKQEAKTW